MQTVSAVATFWERWCSFFSSSHGHPINFVTSEQWRHWCFILTTTSFQHWEGGGSKRPNLNAWCKWVNFVKLHVYLVWIVFQFFSWYLSFNSMIQFRPTHVGPSLSSCAAVQQTHKHLSPVNIKHEILKSHTRTDLCCLSKNNLFQHFHLCSPFHTRFLLPRPEVHRWE